MKTIICQLFLLLVVAYNYSAEAANAADAQVMDKTISDQCIKEGTLSVEDTARITANELFSPKYKETSGKLQCFLLCYNKKMGIVDAQGKQKPQEYMAHLVKRFADKKDKIKSALDKCADIKSANPCEVAYKFDVCLRQQLMA